MREGRKQMNSGIFAGNRRRKTKLLLPDVGFSITFSGNHFNSLPISGLHGVLQVGG